MGCTKITAPWGDAASPDRSGRQAGERERGLEEREHQADAREREADQREERLEEQTARLRQRAVEVRSRARSVRGQAAQAVEQAETVLDGSQDRVRRAEAAVRRAYAGAARVRASAARSVKRGEQHPASQQRDFADLVDRLSTLRGRTAAAAARLAETEEQVARINDELAARDPGNPKYKRLASEAREAMRRARKVERKYSSSLVPRRQRLRGWRVPAEKLTAYPDTNYARLPRAAIRRVIARIMITLRACLCLPNPGMLGGMDSEPGSPSSRREEIGNRLAAVRARLEELRERHQAADERRATSSERLEAAQRHATEAHAAAAQVLASGVEALRMAAEAHERVASLHETLAASGIGEVTEHKRRAALHRAAAAADRQRAERALSLVPEPEPAGPAHDSYEPGDGSPTAGQSR